MSNVKNIKSALLSKFSSKIRSKYKHKKKKENKWDLNVILSKLIKKKSLIFSINLIQLFENFEGIPSFYTISIDFIRRYGIHETRLFRDLPNMNEYQCFLQWLEENVCENYHGIISVSGIDPTKFSPITVAWFLRKFLFQLPESVIPQTYDISERIIQTMDKLPKYYKISNESRVAINQSQNRTLIEHQRCDENFNQLLYVQSLVLSIKHQHFYILKTFVKLLVDIVSDQSDNRTYGLNKHHLGQIFGPILLGQDSLHRRGPIDVCINNV